MGDLLIMMEMFMMDNMKIKMQKDLEDTYQKEGLSSQFFIKFLFIEKYKVLKVIGILINNTDMEKLLIYNKFQKFF